MTKFTDILVELNLTSGSSKSLFFLPLEDDSKTTTLLRDQLFPMGEVVVIGSSVVTSGLPDPSGSSSRKLVSIFFTLSFGMRSKNKRSSSNKNWSPVDLFLI